MMADRDAQDGAGPVDGRAHDGGSRDGGERDHTDPAESREAAVTYGSYLALDELLSLQRPRSEGPEHDEMLFIVIHQVYELWFKELLHEIDFVKGRLRDGDLYRAQHTLKRILTILKVLVGQLDVLETMTPTEFLSFRDRLDSASGFQSHQFRALEFELSQKRRPHVERFPPGSEARRELDRRWHAPTLWDAFLDYIDGAGHPVPRAHLERDVTERVEPSEEIQEILIGIYRDDPKNAALCERMVDLDEGMQEWRYRHVKMVQRTIGGRPGTGGSAGVDYLETTLSQPAFPDLWKIRTRL